MSTESVHSPDVDRLMTADEADRYWLLVRSWQDDLDDLDAAERELFYLAHQWWSDFGPPDAYSIRKRDAGFLPAWPGPLDQRQRALAVAAAIRDQRANGEWADGVLHDGRHPDNRDRRRIDDRVVERFDEDQLLPQPDYALEAGLRPFLERRTDKQRATVYMIHWLRASFREVSRALGSETSGNRSGVAQSHHDQAAKTLRKELIETFAPGADYPNPSLTTREWVEKAWPTRPRGGTGRRFPGPRVRVTVDRTEAEIPEFWPDQAPVRRRFVNPIAVPPKPDSATFEALVKRDRIDLAAAEAHHRRGFAPGFSYGPQRAGDNDPSEGWPNPKLDPGSAGFHDYMWQAIRINPSGELTAERHIGKVLLEDRSRSWVPTDPPTSLAAPRRSDDRGWHEPFLQSDPDVDQAVADLLRRAPNETDRGAGVPGGWFRAVWTGLRTVG